MKTISILIPDGEYPLALRVMRSLGLTHQVTVDLLTSDHRSAYGLSRFCRRCHFTASRTYGEERRDAILRTIETARIDVLLPVSVAGIRLVSAERQTFAARVALPPMPDTATLDIANDKAALYHFAQRHGVMMPPSLVFPDDVTDHAAIARLPYPVLLKPPSLAGGQGIRLFHDPQTLACFLESHGARYLLQSYLPGSDFGLNVLCLDGEIVVSTTQRNAIIAPPPFGPAAGIHFLQDSGVLETGRRLLSALRWNGVANLDMLRCAATGETMVLEVNPRYWGTLLGSVRAGVNFPYLACLAALGRPLPPTECQPISYAEKSVALRQTLHKAAGRPHLPGLRFTNTALWSSLTDPLPAAAHFAKTLVKGAIRRAIKVCRRSRNNPPPPYRA